MRSVLQWRSKARVAPYDSIQNHFMFTLPSPFPSASASLCFSRNPILTHTARKHNTCEYYYNIQIQSRTSQHQTHLSSYHTFYLNTTTLRIYSQETSLQTSYYNDIDRTAQQRSRSSCIRPYGSRPRRKTEMYRLRFQPRPRQLATRRERCPSQDLHKMQSKISPHHLPSDRDMNLKSDRKNVPGAKRRRGR